jgi:hypothetical protein
MKSPAQGALTPVYLASSPETIPPVAADALPPVEAIDIPAVQATDIKVPPISANGEQADRP